MAKGDFIKRNDAEFSAQLTGFKNSIGDYAMALALTAGDITSQANDANQFAYTVICQDLYTKAGKQCTAWRDHLRDGGPAPADGMPVAPTPPDPVPAVAPGIERRFRDLAKAIKTRPAYNEAMGIALGIEGESKGGPDFSVFGPELDLEMQGGQAFVRWGWQGQRDFLDAIEIWVDRGDGQGFRLLTIDTTPGYLDTMPIPAEAARWSYKAIFRVGDQRVGQWSDVATIPVG